MQTGVGDWYSPVKIANPQCGVLRGCGGIHRIAGGKHFSQKLLISQNGEAVICPIPQKNPPYRTSRRGQPNIAASRACLFCGGCFLRRVSPASDLPL